MRRTFRVSSLLAGLVLGAVAALLASRAAAHAQYREFRGKIDKINKKQMIVDNRMGDKLKFQRVDDTAVERPRGRARPEAGTTSRRTSG